MSNDVKTVMAVLIENRRETTEQVQKILTGWGCIIKTRLGIHLKISAGSYAVLTAVEDSTSFVVTCLSNLSYCHPSAF